MAMFQPTGTEGKRGIERERWGEKEREIVGENGERWRHRETEREEIKKEIE